MVHHFGAPFCHIHTLKNLKFNHVPFGNKYFDPQKLTPSPEVQVHVLHELFRKCFYHEIIQWNPSKVLTNLRSP